MTGPEIVCSLREFILHCQDGDQVKMPHQDKADREWRTLMIDPVLTARDRNEVVRVFEELINRAQTGGMMLQSSGFKWAVEWGRFKEQNDGKTTYEILESVQVKVIPLNAANWEDLKPPPPPKPVTMEDFKGLTLPHEMKEEIVAVMKQFEKRELLMEEWGLGEIIEYGRGMIFLFWGPPGTGKTYTARLMAKAIGRTLMTASNAELESNIPGQYERNLRDLFSKAKKTGSILFFDECDGMIQDRAGMGQIMSSQNNCFLQEVERYEGIVVMATNRVDSLDSALERRISLILEFKNPDQDQREKIWERHLPKKLPLAKDVKLAELSDHFLTGGQIKNVVLNAARFAVSRDADKVAKKDFIRAIERAQNGSQAFSAPRSSGVKIRREIVMAE